MTLSVLRTWTLLGLALYGLLVIQVQVLGSWPLLGGQPHLVALSAPIFLCTNRAKLGLGWCVIGGLAIDALLLTPLGTTTLPLLAAYGFVVLLTRRAIDLGAWWTITLLAIGFVLSAQLPLAALQDGWSQLGWDGLAATVLAIPLGIIVASRGSDERQGLRVRA